MKLALATIFGAAMSLVSAAQLFAAEPYDFKVPHGLDVARIRIPKDNPLTAEKIELGKQLYFDPRLSRDNTVSCATCHDPKKGWSNGDAVATGVRGQKGGRSAPTIINGGYLNSGSLRFSKLPMFWDGRAHELEGQALGPIQNPIEMDMPLEEVVVKLNKINGYKEQFQKVFGTEVTADGIGKAIAAFERTILSADAPIDRFLSGDKAAMSEEAQIGWKIFSSGNKGNCTACHQYPNFADGGYHNLGVGMQHNEPDFGYHAITGMEGDKGRFKTPTLREIARTAPYMHDGSQKTLEDVVEFYVKGGEENKWLDEELHPLTLTDDEKKALVTFLKEGLAGKNYPDVEPPKLPE